MSSSIGKPSVCFDNSVVSIANALNEWSRKKKRFQYHVEPNAETGFAESYGG
jgi:hypothetical protein